MGDNTNSAFGFEGRWQEYARIAFTNLLLTIVTLGFYRFWGTARVRRYLWSRTRFIDEHLEWTGTGKELFIGFLFALLLFGPPFLMLNFGVQALILRGHAILAVIGYFVAVIIIFYLAGVARFRAVRYRLSRTYWHGIRGGSDNNGLAYGWTWMWKTVVGYLPAWLLIPWAMMELWNERWRAMSFGSEQFQADGQSAPIFKRFLLFYLAPIILVIAVMILAVTVGAAMVGSNPNHWGEALGAARLIALFGVIFGIYFVIGLIAVAYYAAFLREAIGNLSLGELQFHFDARTKEWLMLFLVDVLLVLLTLGIGMIFLEYRHWRFFITHLEASGEVSLSGLGQSTTRMPTQGEGLLDALDVGAF